MIEKKDKIFSSNPLKSVSGSQFSPIPKSLLNKMAKINMNQSQTAVPPRSSPHNCSPRTYQQENQVRSIKGVTMFQPTEAMQTQMMEDPKNNKRKCLGNGNGSTSSTAQQIPEHSLADLMNKASQAT
ncbi:hypothetical protein MtrunA17_Chr7g0272021 [Medicago truncatula]|uniref:Uncharacterized protein n=1 Tax=Medicago truncatula TaxID=3880 RepID=A0A396HD52_MEDTR|nr:hypothetical protein MtrunA17_Chr7g0272021 [Medicago truncatula]